MVRSFLSFLGAEPEEDTRVLLLLGKGFFMGVFLASYVIAAEVLFLKTPGLGADWLEPAVFTGGAAGLVSAVLFTFLQKRIRFSRLVLFNLLAFAVFMLGISFLFQYTRQGALADTIAYRAVVFTSFVMIGPIAALLLLGFWGTFNRLFNLRQSKRIIGGIDTGQLTATIIAFFAIGLIPKESYDSSDLIVICAICMVGAFVFTLIIVRKYDLNALTEQRAAEASQAEATAKESKYVDLYKNPYLRILSIFLVISMTATLFMEVTFLNTVESYYQDEAELKTFLAFFEGLIMVVSFLIQTFLNDWIIGTYGLRVALLVMPAILGLFVLGASVVSIPYPYEALFAQWTDINLSRQDQLMARQNMIYFFLFVSLGRLISAALKDALESPAYKLFFLPLDIKVRFDIQAKIEGVVNEFSKLIAGVLLLGLGLLTFLNLIHYTVLIIAFVVLMFWVTGKLYIEYRQTLRQTLNRNRKQESTHIKDETNVTQLLEQQLATPNQGKAIYVLKLLERIEPFLTENLMVQLVRQKGGKLKDYILSKARNNTVLAQQPAIRNALNGQSNPEANHDYSLPSLKKLARSEWPNDRIQAAQLLAATATIIIDVVKRGVSLRPKVRRRAQPPPLTII